MKRAVAFAIAAVLLLAPLPLNAQEDGAAPAPKVLQIVREVVKPGKNAAHENFEQGWPKAFRANKSATRYTAVTSITGPQETWFISGFDSMEAWEKANKADDGNPALAAELARLSAGDSEFIEKVSTMTARFREDLSHRPAINIGSYRYMNIVITRVRPGTQPKFVEMRKAIKAAHEKAGMKDWYSVFEITSGITGPAYMIIVPMKSLKESDEAVGLHTSAAYVEALGGEAGQAKMNDLATAAIVNNDNMIFAMNPKMSIPPDNFMARDEDRAFWTPKAPVMAKKPAKDAKTVAKE